MNARILAAADAVDARADGVFSSGDVIAINAWLRADPGRIAAFATLVGTEGANTGFARILGDGGVLTDRGDPLIDGVLRALYSLHNPIVDGSLTDGAGTPVASIAEVAAWLDRFQTDRGTTGTGLDRIVDEIQRDGGLALRTSEARIAEGMDAANVMTTILQQAIAATGALDDGRITVADMRPIGDWVRADPDRFAAFDAAHGDNLPQDDNDTAFHAVQNNGGNNRWFGENFINKVADAIFHYGFEIVGDAYVNENGSPDEAVLDVAGWTDWMVGTFATTGTGLDTLTLALKDDRDIFNTYEVTPLAAAIRAADSLNHLLLDGIAATGVRADGWITADDLVTLSAWVRGNVQRLTTWETLVGDALPGLDGIALLAQSGSKTLFLGEYLALTVADGIYHFGARTDGDRTVTAAGTSAARAGLTDVAAYLNFFVGGTLLVQGDATAETLTGQGGAEQLRGDAGADLIEGRGGPDLLEGGEGADTLLGGEGADILLGGLGDDSIDGGAGGDTIHVSGRTGQGQGFAGYDRYADGGGDGVDTLLALGSGGVDIGLRGFAGTAGIDRIDASGAGGPVRLLDNAGGNRLDFGGVTFVGAIGIEGADGADTITGSAAANTIAGGRGDDALDGGGGGDTFRVGGRSVPSGAFEGYDLFQDQGGSGTDVILAVGTAGVDIGVRGLSVASGIERIDTTGAGGPVRILDGSGAGLVDLGAFVITGAIAAVDGGDGNDTIGGTAGRDALLGGRGDDLIRGAGGDDTLTGGSGADVFVLARGAGADVVTDFQCGVDKLDLRAIGLGGLAVQAVGPDTSITHAEGTIRLIGVAPAQIGLLDLIF